MKGLLLLVGCLFGFPALVGAGSMDSAQPDEAGFSWRYATGGQIRSRPAVGADGTVYAASEDGFLYAINPNGTPAWKCDLGWLPWDCLAVGADGVIYVGLKNRDLVAVNPRGTAIWRVRLDGLPVGDPLMSPGGTLYVGIEPGTIVAMSHRGQREWAVTLPAALAAAPVMDGAGTIYLVAADRRLYALTQWGEFEWSLPLPAAPTAPAIAADGSVLVGTADGDVLSVSPAGDLKWRHPAGAPIAGISIGGSQIVAATTSGRLIGLSAEGRELWVVDVRRRLDSAPLLRGHGLLAFAGDGTLLTMSPPRGATRSVPVGTTGAAVLGQNGAVYLGGRDWIVYAFPRTADAVDNSAPWPQAGHDEKHSGRTPFAPRGGVEARLNANPDYLYLQTLAASGNHEQTVLFLSEVRSRIREGSLGKSTWYVARILDQLVGTGVINPVYQNQKVINNFPDLRAQAADLLGAVGSLGSRWTLLRVVGAETDSYALSSEIRALGALASDGDGASARVIAAAFNRTELSSPDNRVALAVAEALGSITRYMGGFTDPSAAETLMAIAQGPFLDQVRESALAALKQQAP